MTADGVRLDSAISEHLVVTKSGEERLIEWRNSVLRDDAGTAIGTIKSGTDITDRTQALADILTAQERVRFALESAEVGIWTSITRRRLQLVRDPRAAVRPGRGAFAGTFESSARYPPPSVSHAQCNGRAKKDGTDFSVDHRIVRPDGQERIVHGVGRIHLDAKGAAERGVGISMDVTERNLLERRNRQSQKMDAVGQLASGVAHDFNNLLTVILGFAEFVTEDDTISDHNRRDVGEIIKAARRASGLTKQLLAFSRQQLLETVPLDVNKLITA